ncbi:MAG: glycoside hydrolase family 127 protein [Proteobacteria bacterium]|nr:glycoside hydrolase family 127 protein [Pseudomonadota bacterium]
MRIAAAAAALPWAGAVPAEVPPPQAGRRGAPSYAVPERVAEVFASVPFESQQIGGLFGERMRTNVHGRLLAVDIEACLSGFVHRDTAGSFDTAWLGEHAGKFLDAACNALRYREDERLRQRVEHTARTLIGSQRPDGYLGTYPAARRWTGWDVWVTKYTLIGLLSYYELTADPAALQACHAAGDLLARTFGDAPGQRDIIAAGEHMGMAATSVLEPMCRLYRYTAEGRHLEFCRYLVRAYEQAHGPRIVTTLLAGEGVYRVANGKAYEMLSNFNGLVDLYRLTGEQRLLAAVMSGWQDIVRHQLYRTGTASAGEHFQPAGQMLTLQSSNLGETCVTVTWLQLNWRLLRLTGEARFGQEIERTVYNHLLAAQDASSGGIAYYTGFTGRKEFTDAILCCVSSGPRGISLIPQLTWGLEKDAILINLYTPGRMHCEVAGVPVEVSCDTAFPAAGRVLLSVRATRATRFSLRLRVPEWAEGFRVGAGADTLQGRPGELLEVSRTWPRSSTLQIVMGIPARTWPGSPSYPDYLMVLRGPQVLALERDLNPGIPYLHRVGIAPGPVALREVPPAAGRARQVYEFDGIVGLPAGAGRLRPETRAARLVPFADLADGRVWVSREDRLRADVPALTAFARVNLSVLNLRLEPSASPPTDVLEHVTDEDPRSFCTVNPRDFGLANYLGAPPGRRDDPVWFALMLEKPVEVSRIVFRHGAVSATGGWFDTTEGPPRLEFSRGPIATSSNDALMDDSKVHWELAGLLEEYPRTGPAAPPPLTDGQLFELRLPRAVQVHGLRIVGRAGGDYASCAELGGYG